MGARARLANDRLRVLMGLDQLLLTFLGGSKSKRYFF